MEVYGVGPGPVPDADLVRVDAMGACAVGQVERKLRGPVEPNFLLISFLKHSGQLATKPLPRTPPLRPPGQKRLTCTGGEDPRNPPKSQRLLGAARQRTEWCTRSQEATVQGWSLLPRGVSYNRPPSTGWPGPPTSTRLPCCLQAVQNVGNLGTSVTGTKEAWMAPLQPAIQQGVAQMKQLILQLVDIEEKEESDLQEALSLQSQVVKEGPLFIYKNKGKGPLLSPSFKKLHFSLTSDALTYAKTPNSKKIAFITPANIRAAEKVEEKSFGNAHVMQIIHTNENGQPDTAYLQCKVEAAGSGQAW
ncbi:Ras GTPase-activating protein 4 [Varanus komodoensis]|nr:Ras GTPase-activating protein 4 [Varanus komodoensis]